MTQEDIDQIIACLSSSDKFITTHIIGVSHVGSRCFKTRYGRPKRKHFKAAYNKGIISHIRAGCHEFWKLTELGEEVRVHLLKKSV